MRMLMAGLLAASFLATNAFADDAPLPSGKAAGVKTAQDADNTLFFLLGGAAVVAGVVILATGDSDSTLVPGTTTTTTGT